MIQQLGFFGYPSQNISAIGICRLKDAAEGKEMAEVAAEYFMIALTRLAGVPSAVQSRIPKAAAWPFS